MSWIKLEGPGHLLGFSDSQFAYLSSGDNNNILMGLSWALTYINLSCAKQAFSSYSFPFPSTLQLSKSQYKSTTSCTWKCLTLRAGRKWWTVRGTQPVTQVHASGNKSPHSPDITWQKWKIRMREEVLPAHQTDWAGGVKAESTRVRGGPMT